MYRMAAVFMTLRARWRKLPKLYYIHNYISNFYFYSTQSFTNLLLQTTTVQVTRPTICLSDPLVRGKQTITFSVFMFMESSLIIMYFNPIANVEKVMLYLAY